MKEGGNAHPHPHEHEKEITSSKHFITAFQTQQSNPNEGDFNEQKEKTSYNEVPQCHVPETDPPSSGSPQMYFEPSASRRHDDRLLCETRQERNRCASCHL